MSGRAQGIDDEVGNAVVREESQRHSSLGHHREFGELASVVQAGSNLLACQIWKFGDNLLGRLARSQVAQNQAYGDAGSLDARPSVENFRVACDVIFPGYRHVTRALPVSISLVQRDRPLGRKPKQKRACTMPGPTVLLPTVNRALSTCLFLNPASRPITGRPLEGVNRGAVCGA